MTESVLFICDDNSVLSQMAEAFLRRYGWSAYKVYSAGVEPKPVHLHTLQVMEEIGYELDGYHSKSIFHFNFLHRIDYLITLSDFANQCITFDPNAVGCHLHWPFDSPLEIEPSPSVDSQAPVETLDIALYELETPSIIARVETKIRAKRILYESSPQETARDVSQLMARFRLVRDQMECQIMSWLDEKGLGPFWWRGNR